MKSSSLSHLLLWVIAAAAYPVLADDQAVEAAAPVMEDESNEPKLEMITIQADRSSGFQTQYVQVGAFRDANILDVPLTINVMPRDLLDAQDAQGLFDALKNSAGVTRSQTSGTAADNLSLRGIAVENRTNYRLNGSLPINNLIDTPLENKERVEALKGSSALYYGFTSPAGVVNLVTKRATKDPISRLTVSGNEFGTVYGHADVGRTFGSRDQIGVRVNLLAGDLSTAIDDLEGDRSLYSAAIDWQATDKLGFRIDYEKLHKDIVEQSTVTLNPAVNNVITLPALPPADTLLSGPWAVWRGRAENGIARADYSINDNWHASIETGRAETFRDTRAATSVRQYNLDTGQGILRSNLVRGQRYYNRNDRVEVAGRFRALLDHEVTIGFMRNKRYQNGPVQQQFNTPQNLYIPIQVVEPIYSLVNPATNPQDVEDKGFYLLDRVRLGEKWQVLAGARQSDYVNESVSGGVLGVYDAEELTPSVGVIFKPLPHTSIYATYIEGLEEGGTAPIVANNAFEVLPPGVTEQAEVGVRTEAWAGLTATLAAFKIQRDAAQLNAANFFVLDGELEYQGVEYSIVGEIGTQWSVFVSGQYLDAEQTKSVNPALIGTTPENTPEQAHSAFVEYRPSFLRGFAVNGGAFYVGERPANNLNQAFIPGYTLYTFGTQYTAEIGSTKTTLQVNVENLADKEYWSASGAGLVAVGLPRTIKFKVGVAF